MHAEGLVCILNPGEVHKEYTHAALLLLLLLLYTPLVGQAIQPHKPLSPTLS
jgi:hypothetical protein